MSGGCANSYRRMTLAGDVYFEAGLRRFIRASELVVAKTVPLWVRQLLPVHRDLEYLSISEP